MRKRKIENGFKNRLWCSFFRIHYLWKIIGTNLSFNEYLCVFGWWREKKEGRLIKIFSIMFYMCTYVCVCCSFYLFIHCLIASKMLILPSSSFYKEAIKLKRINRMNFLFFMFESLAFPIVYGLQSSVRASFSFLSHKLDAVIVFEIKGLTFHWCI